MGYRCAWFGKWHLSGERTARDFGFEGVSLAGYGYPYGSDSYRTYLETGGLAQPVATVELPGESGLPPGTQVRLCERDDWPDFEAGTALLDGPAAAHESYFVAQLARTWLSGVGDTPFFLRVDPWGPHPPYVVAPPFRDRFAGAGDLRPTNFWHDLAGRPAHHRDYRDTWRSLGLDDAGWRLLAQRSLEQAALVESALLGLLDTLEDTGLAARTLVVVTADHGDGVASNGGIANKGGLMVEETLRVPLLLRGPGLGPVGPRGQLVSTLDIAPTLLDLAGLAVPEGLHGTSLRPLLADPTAHGREGLMLQHYGLHVPVMQRAWREADWKLVVQEDGFAELYDLSADPCEMHNLAAAPRAQGRLGAMRKALARAMRAAGDDGCRQRALLAAAGEA